MRTRGLRSVLSTAASTLICAGCLPHVMHGPRVEDDGWSGSLSLTLGRNREIGEQANFVPSLYGGLRRSYIAPAATTPALSLGLQVPVLIAPFLADDDVGDKFEVLTSTSYADFYIQPLRRDQPGFEWGIGVLSSTAVAAPYIQAGVVGADGDGWYTTQLVGFSIADEFIDGWLYMPTVVVRQTSSDDATAGNFSAGLGLGFNENGGTDVLFTFGMTIELGLGRN